MGNPLLDISANVGQDMLDKYDLRLANAILCEEKHQPIYSELVEKYDVTYVAGGATQNSIRVAQWMIGQPGATSFIGCVGKDSYGEQLRKSAEADGVSVRYLEDAKTPTGTCACLIKDTERSLVANLAAANCYQVEHLLSEEITPVKEAAKYFYLAGFFLTVSPPSIMHIAEHASKNGKTFMMNLSAEFICQFFSDPLQKALPYIDILFGNESEAKAFGESQKYDDVSVPAVALKLASWERVGDKPRIVVITQGSDCTVVATEGKVTTYAVTPVAKESIVDTNGAGDAFVGGFISQLVQGKPIDTCVAAGHYAAGVVIQVSGTVLPNAPTFSE